jgi:succinate-acetate transporter protein
MALMCFIYLICSIRTNVAFFVIFLSLTFAFGLLSGCYWEAAQNNITMAKILQTAAGASCFVTCAAGWWIFVAVMFEALDFPFAIPGKFS